MDMQELTNSGELELYVCGALNSIRQREVTQLITTNKPLLDEVIKIENAYIHLSSGLAPNDLKVTYPIIAQQLKNRSTTKTINLWTYIGWAAAVVFLLTAGYYYTENQLKSDAVDNLNSKVTDTNKKIESLKEVNALETAFYSQVLDLVNDPTTLKVNLAGQENYEASTAVAYYNAQLSKTLVNFKDLEPLKENQSYQLWSLTLDPLTPTSLGVIESSSKLVDEKIYIVDNSNASEALGITIEPYGGSSSPTLNNLLVLGTIN